jgi:beta-galactosidase
MFAEPTAIGAGERLIDVAVNGVARIENFDILAAAGGPLKGVNRALDATVTDGILTLAFRPRRGDALVSALSITPLDPR